MASSRVIFSIVLTFIIAANVLGEDDMLKKFNELRTKCTKNHLYEVCKDYEGALACMKPGLEYAKGDVKHDIDFRIMLLKLEVKNSCTKLRKHNTCYEEYRVKVTNEIYSKDNKDEYVCDMVDGTLEKLKALKTDCPNKNHANSTAMDISNVEDVQDGCSRNNGKFSACSLTNLLKCRDIIMKSNKDKEANCGKEAVDKTKQCLDALNCNTDMLKKSADELFQDICPPGSY